MLAWARTCGQGSAAHPSASPGRQPWLGAATPGVVMVGALPGAGVSLGAPAPKAAPVAQPCCHVLASVPAVGGTSPSPGCPEMVSTASGGGVPACDATAARRGSPATHLPPRGLVAAHLCLPGSSLLQGLKPGPHCSGDLIPPLILAVGSQGTDNDEGVKMSAGNQLQSELLKINPPGLLWQG